MRGERPIRSEERLSDFETLLWTLERDPQLASGFANITLLDRPAHVEAMRARMLHAAATIPQLRRRLLMDPTHMTTPRWIDDPDFAIERHVTTLTLASPGTIDALIDTAMAFCHRPYDSAHPLWEFTLVDGLADGRGAMLQRFHHSVSDGVGMMRLSEQFIDLERDAPLPEPIPLPEAAPLPSSLGASRDALGHTLQRGLQGIQNGLATTSELLRDSERILDGAKRSLDIAKALIAETATVGKRQSPLWTERSDGRTLRLLRVPFAEVRNTSKTHGVTINDFFVAAAAGGAGDYHRIRGTPVDTLRMAMPISTRNDRSAAGNAFGMSRIVVSTRPDPLARLATIHDTLAETRSGASVSLPQIMAGPANLLPAPLLVQITRAQVSTVDFTTSNVRGAPFPVFLAGARVEANHPIGPLVGTAYNLTMLSYNGSLDMGLHIDTGAIDDPDLLARCIQGAFDELLAS